MRTVDKVKHTYTSEDATSGIWLTEEDEPRAYCHWSWDEEDLELVVVKGVHSRRVKLPTEDSAARSVVLELPDIAKRIADEM